MNYYEVLLMVDPILDETNIEAKIKEFEDIITKNSGEIIKVENQGRKRLSYTVNKHTEATFVHFSFDIDHSQVKSLESELSENESILRFLLTKEKKGRKSSLDVPESYAYN